MKASFVLDLSPRPQTVSLSLAASDAWDKDYSDLLDEQIRAVASVADAQGFPAKGYTSAMGVASGTTAEASNERSYVLECEGVDRSVWRALTGLLFTFDYASKPLSSINLQSRSAAATSLRRQDIMTIPYPARSSKPNFDLQEDAGPDRSILIEIRLLAGVTRDRSDAILGVLDNWLMVANGGFFMDGEHPVTNAHDCPRFKRVGSRYLAARLGTYTGSPAAFDVLLNVLSYLQSRYLVIEACRIH